MMPNHFLAFALVAGLAAGSVQPLCATTVSTPFGRSVQVNVNAAGENIAGDAANEQPRGKLLRIIPA